MGERGYDWMCLRDSGMLTQRALLRHPNLTAKLPQIHLNSSVQRYTVEQSGKNAKTDATHYKIPQSTLPPSEYTPKLWSLNFQSTDVEEKTLRCQGYWMRWVAGEPDLKKAMGNQRIRTTRWKTKSWNKFSSPYEAQPDSLVEKDHLTSKWLWFPNTPGIFLNSPRILGMLSLAALQTLGKQ